MSTSCLDRFSHPNSELGPKANSGRKEQCSLVVEGLDDRVAIGGE